MTKQIDVILVQNKKILSLPPFTYEYPRPAVTVDAVVFRRREDNMEVLLIRRDRYPFEGRWALPGGFMDMGETLEEAVVRELEEETGLKGIALQQLHAFSALHRDPRGRTVSVIFWGTAPADAAIRAGDDAREAAWFPLENLPELAFDHGEIVGKALERLPQE
ncbi:MAG: NUDIX hydrolase [Bacteroidales bacterium]|nr:NUDIX hydrolase [Bacteroidales bacterium]